MADVRIDPKNSALLLMDLQNEIVKGAMPIQPPDSAALLNNCRKVLSKARQMGMPVVYVQVVRRPDRKDAPRPPLGARGAGGGPSLTAGAPGTEIVSELAPRPEDYVVTKHTTSPFNTTDIEVYLRRLGVTTLLLAGYSTTGVVEGCLRDARDKDYDCVVIRDCCAAQTLQEHQVCMDTIFPRMAWVATADEVIQAIM